MNSLASLVALALTAPAVAFQPSNPASARQSAVAHQMALRDIASYPDDMKMMSEFEAFDRNGAFSRSPQGGQGGRSDMNMYQGGSGERMMGPGPDMYQGQGQGQGQGGGMMSPNPFSRRGQGQSDRMYTRDGFDPYSAYGESHGMSQSDRRDPRGMGGNNGGGMSQSAGRGPQGMGGGQQGFYGGPDMMMGGGGGGRPMGGGGRMNGVKADNTMGGFSYSSRNREYADGYGAGPMMYGPPQSQFEYEQGMMGGYEGPMGGMGGMEGMEYEQGYPMGGDYGGYDGDMSDDMSRMAP